MDYQKIYDSLIERARERRLSDYTESHQIVPVCMGGKDIESNLVDLTAEEHFLAHKLLVKIHPDNWKLAFALLAMSRNTNGYRPNNKLFGWTRRRVYEAHSAMKRGVPRPRRVIESMRSVNLGGKHSAEHRAKISAALTWAFRIFRWPSG